MPNTNTSTPLTPASSTGAKVAAGGILAFNTGLVAGAPLMGGINPMGAGGLGVVLIGGGILVIVQAISAQHWFDDQRWAVWLCIALSIIICVGLYVVLLGNIELGVLNALGSMHQAAGSYGPLRQLGVYNRGEK